MNKNHNLNKLPKWAKDEIERLNRDVEYHRREKARIGVFEAKESGRSPLPEGTIEIVDYSNCTTEEVSRVVLYKNQFPRFWIKGDETDHVGCVDVNFRIDGGELFIDVNSSTSAVLVKPRASNSFFVSITER